MAKKEERKGAMTKKVLSPAPKFWLMRVRQIKILPIFVPYSGKSIFLVKNSFLSKTKAHLASYRPKNELTIKNGIFVRIWKSKGQTKAD